MGIPPVTGRDTDTLLGTGILLAVLYQHETLTREQSQEGKLFHRERYPPLDGTQLGGGG